MTRANAIARLEESQVLDQPWMDRWVRFLEEKSLTSFSYCLTSFRFCLTSLSHCLVVAKHLTSKVLNSVGYFDTERDGHKETYKANRPAIIRLKIKHLRSSSELFLPTICTWPNDQGL